MGISNEIKRFLENLNYQLSGVDKKVNSITKNVERRIYHQIQKVKKEVISLVLLIIFLSFTLVFFAVGMVVFFNRFFDLDIVLLGFGVLFALIALLIKVVM